MSSFHLQKSYKRVVCIRVFELEKAGTHRTIPEKKLNLKKVSNEFKLHGFRGTFRMFTILLLFSETRLSHFYFHIFAQLETPFRRYNFSKNYHL